MLINDKQCFLMLFICYVLEPKCDQMTASVQKKCLQVGLFLMLILTVLY